MNLTLSLFPGIGLLDSAFESEGYCVVRGPDVIWGGDIRTFHPPAGVFHGIIGGPPCQSFSSLAHLVRANGYEPKFGNLIREFARCVLEAQPAWFVMENAPQAPEPVVAGYGVRSFLLDNSALAGEGGWGLEQKRLRRFCFGVRGVEQPPCLLRWVDMAVFLLPDADRAQPVTAGHGGGSPEDVTAWSRRRRNGVSGSGGGLSVQGLPEPEYNRRKAAGRPVRHETVTGGHDKPPSVRQRAVTSNVGGFTDGSPHPDSPKAKRQGTVTGSDGGAAGMKPMRRYRRADALRLQGLPPDFCDHMPFTAEVKLKAVANGVPLPMGIAIAKAVKEALRIGGAS